MVLMLLISIGSNYALSAMRAYVAGHSVWIGAEADTNAAMHRFLARPSDAHLAALESPISIWAGDHAARLELLKSNPDYELAGRGLRAGGNHPANIDGMIRLFRIMRWVPAWQEPLRIWADADQQFERYLPLKLRMQARLADGSAGAGNSVAWRDAIDGIHAPIVLLEHQFAQAIDNDARRLTALLLAFLAISTAVLLAAGYLAARRILKRTDDMAAALRATERQAFEEHERAAVLLRSIGDAVISTDRLGIVQFLNGAAEQLTGMSVVEACGRPLEEVFRLADAGDARGTLLRDAIERFMSEASDTLIMGNGSELIRSDGTTTPIGERAARLRNRDGDVIGLVLVMRDVTHERRLSDQLRYQATHDALTGLANRSHFEHRSRSIQNRQRYRRTCRRRRTDTQCRRNHTRTASRE
jgi:PAS domain S-box-containing protein